MIFKNKIVWLLLIVFIGSSIDSFSQRRRYGMKRKSSSRKISRYHGGSTRAGSRGIGASKYSTVGFSINAMNYFGDIAPLPKRLSTDYSFTRAGFGLTFSHVVHPNAAIRAGVNWGTIKAEDFKTADPSESLGRYQRNLQFRNRILEFSIGGEFNLIPNNGGPNNRFPLNPYIFLGIAVFKHNPQALAPELDLLGNQLAEAGEWVDLQPLGTEGQNIDGSSNSPYKLVQIAIPIGLGVKVRLPGNFDANIEIGFRQTLTDYLDDVSTNYPDLGQLDSELARALSARGSELTAVGSGDTRDVSLIGLNTFTSPTNSQAYNVGGNYTPDGVRGGSKDKDMYIVTQLRLVYILSAKSRRRGKFR